MSVRLRFICGEDGGNDSVISMHDLLMILCEAKGKKEYTCRMLSRIQSTRGDKQGVALKFNLWLIERNTIIMYQLTVELNEETINWTVTKQ